MILFPNQRFYQCTLVQAIIMKQSAVVWDNEEKGSRRVKRTIRHIRPQEKSIHCRAQAKHSTDRLATKK